MANLTRRHRSEGGG